MKKKSSDIVIFHVGGGQGSLGPVDSLINLLPKNCVVYIFDGSNEFDNKMKDLYIERGVRFKIVQLFIGPEKEKRDFYVNEQEASSSLLKPSKQTVNDHIFPNCPLGVSTWGQNTKLSKKIEIETTSLLAFMNKEMIFPDVLSLDVQGIEFDILKSLSGGGDGFLVEVKAIVSEVEFFEIYEGQGFFSDQSSFLRERGFRLAEIYNKQYWHSGPVCGDGFLTVGEALWLKLESDEFIKVNSDYNIMIIIKLAVIAYSFKRLSYAYYLIKKLMNNFGKDFILSELSNDFNCSDILKLVNVIDYHMIEYKKDNSYFKRNFEIT